MLRRTEAIVLKTTPFSEADLIVSFLTLDYGLLKAFAKSPRKTKSRFGSSLEPLTYSKISFYGREDASLPRLTQSDIIKPFQSIRDRMECFFKVMEIIELTLSLLPEREANRDIFHLLLSVLGRIEKEISGTPSPQSPPLKGGEKIEEIPSVKGGEFRESLALREGSLLSPLPWRERARVRGDFQEPINLCCIFYKVRFLDMAGYEPRLDGCARCGKSGYNFYLSHGSVICGACAEDTGSSMRLSPGVKKIYETLKKWDLAKLDRIKLSQPLFSELSGLLDSHILHTVARPLKTITSNR